MQTVFDSVTTPCLSPTLCAVPPGPSGLTASIEPSDPGAFSVFLLTGCPSFRHWTGNCVPLIALLHGTGCWFTDSSGPAVPSPPGLS